MIRKHVKNICLGLLIAGAAAASPLTYNFTQGGWPTGSMNGSFTGAPEANGVINLADLTSFNATFFDLPAASFPFSLSNLDGFFFNTADPYSLEFAGGSLRSNIVLCSGAAETAKVCGVPPPPPPPPGGVNVRATGFFEDLPLFGPFETGSGTVVAPVTATASTPEPGTASLLALVAGSLLLVGGVRRRFLN